MKIGILTLCLHTNYGGILQAYALQTVLERMGHEVIIFNKPAKKPKQNLFTVLKRIIKKTLGYETVIFKETRDIKEYPIVNEFILDFRKKYLKEVQIYRLSNTSIFNLSCIIVGSDQVWRPQYFKRQWEENMPNAFLAFTSGWNIKRVAYGASFGVDNWEYNSSETEAIRRIIHNFDIISVREETGVNLINDNLFAKATQVLDPTMLLDKDDYIRIIDNSQVPTSNGNLLVYILDNNAEKKRIVKTISKKKSLTPFSVNVSNIPITAPIKERIKPSVESWLRGFFDTEFVITDSFHAVVFSIIFNKPFWVIGNKERGLSRFNSILKMFHLENRLLDESDLNVSFERLEPIDWAEVNHIKDEWRSRSISLLKKGIEL